MVTIKGPITFKKGQSLPKEVADAVKKSMGFKDNPKQPKKEKKAKASPKAKKLKK